MREMGKKKEKRKRGKGEDWFCRDWPGALTNLFGRWIDRQMEGKKKGGKYRGRRRKEKERKNKERKERGADSNDSGISLLLKLIKSMPRTSKKRREQDQSEGKEKEEGRERDKTRITTTALVLNLNKTFARSANRSRKGEED